MICFARETNQDEDMNLHALKRHSLPNAHSISRLTFERAMYINPPHPLEA